MITGEKYSSFEEMNAAADRDAAAARAVKKHKRNTIAYFASLLRRNAARSPLQASKKRN